MFLEQGWCDTLSPELGFLGIVSGHAINVVSYSSRFPSDTLEIFDRDSYYRGTWRPCPLTTKDWSFEIGMGSNVVPIHEFFCPLGPTWISKLNFEGIFFFWIFRDGCGPLGSLHPPIIFQFWMRKSDKSWTCVGVLPNFEIILLRYYYDVTIYWFSSTRFDSVQLIIIAKPIIWKTCLSLLFTKKTHTHTQFKEPVQTIWITVLKFGSVRLIFFRKPLMISAAH